MAPQSFAERVLRLEEQMSGLSELPKKVDDLGIQIAQLRADMHGEFSAVRSEMTTEFAAVRSESRESDQDTRRQMRVLHEELIGRLALLQEGFDAFSSGLRSRHARR